MMAYKKRNSTLKRVILVAMSIIYVAALFAYRGMQSVPEEHSGFHSRRILSTEDNTTSAPQTPSSNQTNSRYTGSQPAEKKCNEPSISHFPKDVFTQHQRRYGAVLLHTFLALYMFAALAFVCDDYFISALDKICSRLDLSEDVAGATFMAAGSSAPELFTSLIGVLITKGDVGVGTVVGSAVFNLLVIIALCGTFAGQVVQLTKWPLIRDSACYLLSIGALIGVIYDNQVTWFESTTMMCMYILYIVLMKFNPTIVNAFEVRKNKKSEIMNGDTSTKLINDNQPLVVRYTFDHRHGSHNNIFISNPENRQKWRELTMRVMLSERFTPTTRFRAACHVMLSRRGLIQSGEFGKEEKDIVFSNGHAKLADEEKDISTESGGSDDLVGPLVFPGGSCVKVAFWILTLPLTMLMYCTIPDCRKPRWEAWYLITFFMSVVWIFIFSYIMVWMVCVIGFTLGIPDVIMGITFLAAGTSIPDCIASLLVAREGLGDMAISNSIGSNIFDILIGLALPWFIKTALMDTGMTVEISSKGMLYSVALLFASVFLTIFLVNCNKWQLTKPLGVMFFIIYVAFISVSACIEFNLFAFVNLPTCAYSG